MNDDVKVIWEKGDGAMPDYRRDELCNTIKQWSGDYYAKI
jgi:hypothetical protein